jgi:hypothetical protein
MAAVDRILQLKLVLDSGELVAGLNDTNGKLGALGSQVGGFIKSAGIGLAMEGIDLALDSIGQGIQDSLEWRDALRELGAAFAQAGLDASDLEGVAERMGAQAISLGFDDAEAVQGLADLTLRLGDAEQAAVAMDAAMDLARGRGISLGEATAEVGAIIQGSSRTLAEYGVAGQGAAGSFDNVALALGGMSSAAEDFAATSEGQLAILQTSWGETLGDFGKMLTDLADQALPVIVNDLLPALAEGWAIVQPPLQLVLEAVGSLVAAFGELLPHIANALAFFAPLASFLAETFVGTIQTVAALISALAKLLSGDIPGAIGTMAEALGGVLDIIVSPFRDGINTIIGLWNSIGLPAFSINLPAIVIPVLDHTIFPGGPFQLWPSIGLPDIPLLARGGIVLEPTLAILGEKGREAVVPLDQGGLGGVTNVYVTQNISGDPRIVEAAVLRVLRRYVTDNGTPRLDPLRA